SVIHSRWRRVRYGVEICATISPIGDANGTMIGRFARSGALRRSSLIEDSPMNHELAIEQLFHALITGDRIVSRQLVNDLSNSGVSAEGLAHDIYWPLLEMIGTLYRADQITVLAHHYATRLLRLHVDQTQARYVQQPRCGRSIMLFCGPGEA